MHRRLGLAALGLLLIALAAALLLTGRTPTDVPRHVEGDVSAAVADMDPAEMADRAEAFLATGRPWRAARVMRRYRELEPDLAPDRVVLAARAEAGWGAWPEVLTLLRDVPALDTHHEGVGLWLLGRALDEEGHPGEAAEAYRAFLALTPPAGTLEEERAAARLRLGLALLAAGDAAGARVELERAGALAGEAASWLRLLEADALARAGDTLGVRRRVAGMDSGIPGLRAWRARIAAARAAGDVAAARTLANEARAWASTDATEAEFLVEAARAAREMGDEARARAALRSAIDKDPASRHGRAAAELLREGERTPGDHLAVARVLVAQGLHEEALDGFRQWLASGEGSAAARADVHMEHARALFYAERYDEVEEALAPIAGDTQARFLLARAESHRGDPADAVRTYLALAERFARTGTGANALFLAAGTWHDEGETRRARELYRRVVSEYPGRAEMGLALLRLAGIAFAQEEYADAAALWDEYRRRYPRGDRALQAAYWSGRARAEAGDSAAAATLFRQVRSADRDSYYALLASRRLGEPFWPLPMSPAPAESPAAARTVRGWMRGVDLLRTAGFPEEASAEADRLAEAVGRDRATRYALAEALAERGYSQRAIRLGIALGTSAPPDRRLLRIRYPFPYRTLITEEARDRGLDPYVAAALIRQESMFEARITSHVGARGLMQIMPATGQELAEVVGIDRWDPELLYHPEINVHLGTRYLARDMEAYDGSLPAVFSSYNAGPHRVEWWSEYPEYGQDELFTERIPYRETRDYVKILTRNHALYSGLYGGEAEASSALTLEP